MLAGFHQPNVTQKLLGSGGEDTGRQSTISLEIDGKGKSFYSSL